MHLGYLRTASMRVKENEVTKDTMKSPSLLASTLIGFLLVLFQLTFFWFNPWGDGLAPVHIPAIATIFYALWCRSLKFSFSVGFWSLMAMFMAPMIFYMELPPIMVLIPMIGWGIMFGLLGVSVAFISKRLTP